jgi:hypothetical protein
MLTETCYYIFSFPIMNAPNTVAFQTSEVESKLMHLI